ncbi:hypothetical protein [Lysobacter sp. FW306-1B-D06B]|uniref:hypothetical protein n=1 Tax=Lysobacter sp. FW306-1B-D06B TaxID=3140250 RepID=UPI0031404352
MPKSISLLLLGIAFACGGCAKTPEPVCMAPGHIDDGSCTTALLNILASPESYEGKTVSVLGFVEVVPGNNGEAIFFYPSRDARALQATTTAVRVRAEGRQLELIRGRHRVEAPAYASGVFTRAASSSGMLGEIRVRSE